MWTESEGRRQKTGCRSGENLGAAIRYKWLGHRALRRPRRNRNTRQILESEGEVTARQEPRPTGRAQLPLSPIQSSVTVSLGQPSWVDEGCGPTVRDFRYRFKCITVIHLIRGWAVTTY